MNKEQKRNLTKKLRAKGKTSREIEDLIKLKIMIDTPCSLKDGDRVMLNVNKIKSDVNWERKVPKYKEFVESNVGIVFTVKRDENRRENSNLVYFEEDERKWLWWEGDLIKQTL